MGIWRVAVVEGGHHLERHLARGGVGRGVGVGEGELHLAAQVRRHRLGERADMLEVAVSGRLEQLDRDLLVVAAVGDIHLDRLGLARTRLGGHGEVGE